MANNRYPACMLPSSSNLQQAPSVDVPQHHPKASTCNSITIARRPDAPRRTNARQDALHKPITRMSPPMRLPGCNELVNGVPAPDSLWAKADNGSPLGKMPLLDGYMQPVWCGPATSRPDNLRSIRPVASPKPLHNIAPPVGHSSFEPSPALLFSSLPLSRPSYATTPSSDQQVAGILLPYKYKNPAHSTPYTSSISSSWSPPSSASSFSPGLTNGLSSQATNAHLESPRFFTSPPSFLPSPPQYSRDPLYHQPTTPPLGRLRPVDPSWCAEPGQSGPCLRHASSNSASGASEHHNMSDDDESIIVVRKRKRAPGRGKPQGEAHTTALDNDPAPFNLDNESYNILKDHLWIRDGVMSSSFHCRWRGCNRRVSTGESQIPTHYTDVHNLSPGSPHVRCRWVDEKGKLCTAQTSFHNYRLHVLDVHLRANSGRCRICNHTMTNSGGMKRHLKRCMRGRTVEEMWQQYGLHIILPPPGVEGAEGRCYVPP